MNADMIPEEPSNLEEEPVEPDEVSDLDFTEMPCTDEAGQGGDESLWDAFLPDDEWDPEPDPGDFWIENRSVDEPEDAVLFPLLVFPTPRLIV